MPRYEAAAGGPPRFEAAAGAGLSGAPSESVRSSDLRARDRKEKRDAIFAELAGQNSGESRGDPKALRFARSRHM